MNALAMLPLHLDTWIVSLLIGVAFGYTLESSGFGDARRLAAQFYLQEMRVLKVMFMAIVTCMLLIAWSSALGWLDFEALFVNPTYLGSGILGGFLLGLGFIIGGYCPGTSIVSMATLKVDGAIFVGGVGIGSFVFGETADGFREFYDTAGFLGRFTLPEWLGLPAGVVVLLVVLMAGFMFWGGEILERTFGRGGKQEGKEQTGARPGFWRPAMKGGAVAMVVFLVLAFALPFVGQPTIEERVQALDAETTPLLESRDVQIEPIEMLGLMHNHVQGSLGRFRLVILDVRDESEFNLFHLVDARHVTLDELKGDAGRALRDQAYDTAIFVVAAQGEVRSTEAWKILHAQGVRNAYVLAGGLDRWLEVFRGSDASFDTALGDRYPFARPTLPVFQQMVKAEADGDETAWKVKPVVKAAAPTGGCG